MQTNLTLRNDMMVLTKTALDGAAVKQIRIMSSDNTPLCNLPYLSYTKKALTGTSSVYEFKGIDGSNSLKSGVLAAGVASKFEIDGLIDAVEVVVFNGSVGATSSFDIQFNTVNWTADTFIEIVNLNIQLKQGV